MGMKVEITDGPASYFAKQIAVEPDYILTVNPTSVREDAGPTDIEVKVEQLAVNLEVATDTPVPLQLAPNQLGQDRFSIDSYPTITIPEGEKEGTGTINIHPH